MMWHTSPCVLLLCCNEGSAQADLQEQAPANLPEHKRSHICRHCKGLHQTASKRYHLKSVHVPLQPKQHVQVEAGRVLGACLYIGATHSPDSHCIPAWAACMDIGLGNCPPDSTLENSEANRWKAVWRGSG